VTDFVQFIILWLAVCMVFPLSFHEVGGITHFINTMPKDFTMLLHPPYDLYQYLVYMVFFCITYNASWSMIQKYNCVRNERDAQKVAVTAIMLTVLSMIIFFVPPMFARTIFPGLENPRFSYAVLCLRVLPIGLIGFLLTGILSATLSTLSNEYTMLSSVLTNDFYAKKIRKAASERHLVKVGRVNSVIVGIITTLIAVGLQRIEGMNLFDIMMKAYTAFAPAIMTPLIGGILIRRLNSKGTMTGIIAGIVSGLSLLALNIVLVGMYHDQFVGNPQVNYWLNQGWTASSIIVNLAVTIIGLWIGSISKATPDEEKQRIDRFFTLLKTPYETEVRERSESPFPVIGLTVAIMGAGMTMVAGVVLFLFHSLQWFFLNMTAGAILLVLGWGIRYLSRKRMI